MKLLPMMLVLLVTGCSKNATKSATPRSQVVSPPRSSPPRVDSATTEVAQAELQGALIHLRRVHFDFDTATLRPQARVTLEAAAKQLAPFPDVELYVDGHTDERGTTEYNIALGERRANVVIDYLVRLGIERGRLHATSFGEERPLLDGGSSDNLASNRRAEFRLMRGNVQLVLDEGVRFGDDGVPIEGEPSEGVDR